MQEVAYLATIGILGGTLIFLVMKFEKERQAWRATTDRLLDRIQARDLGDLQRHGPSIDRSLTTEEREELEALRKLKDALQDGISIG
jgi:hypothetical protein